MALRINSGPYVFHSLPKNTEGEYERIYYAHQTIGDLYSQIADHLKKGESIPGEIFKQLGVHPKDKEAVSSMQNICQVIIEEDSHRIIPSLDPGVFYVLEAKDVSDIDLFQQKNTEVVLEKINKSQITPIAVFKVGRKRAQLELVARRIASLVKLDRHIIFGMFASLKMSAIPPFWNEELEMTEDLWNGDTKRYKPINSPDSGYIVGILQPFIKKSEEAVTTQERVRQLAHMTVLAIVLGLRDARDRNIINDMFIDNEEFFPSRLDPDPEQGKAAAASHLPYLFDYPECEDHFSGELIEELYELTQKIDAFVLAKNLTDIKKCFFDTVVDDIEIKTQASNSPLSKSVGALSLSEDSDEDDIQFISSSGEKSETEEESSEIDEADEEFSTVDEGGCMVSIESCELEDNPLFLPNSAPSVFSEAQCAAFTTRIAKLKRLFLDEFNNPHRALSCMDIVKRIDPFFAYQMRSCRSSLDVGVVPSPFLPGGTSPFRPIDDFCRQNSETTRWSSSTSSDNM